MEYPREIKIGETTYSITRFRGMKAAIAGALVSRVMRKVPEIQDRVVEFRRQFRENNTVRITPAVARLPRFAALGLTAEDFAASGGVVEFPEEPDNSTMVMHIWPDLFELAEEELKKFFALIAIPNRDLAEADDADEVDSVLEKYGKRLFQEGDIDELLELTVVGVEVLQDQLLSKKERLGKFQQLLPFLRTPQSMPETPEQESSNPTTLESTPPPSSVPASPTDSPTDSDGTEEPLSTESPGMSFRS